MRQQLILLLILCTFGIGTTVVFLVLPGYLPRFLPSHGLGNDESTIGSLPLNAIANLPRWYRNEDWGLTQEESLKNLSIRKKTGGKSGEDNEEETAWNNFFFGTTKGLVLEMGARDGLRSSPSEFFEKEANWRAILIEGDPKRSYNLSDNRPNALCFQAAVCAKRRMIHYLSSRWKFGITGILEFMSDGVLEKYHPDIFTKGTIDMVKVEAKGRSDKIMCLPLLDLLSPFNFKHINYFVLDVEGAELSILETINFDQLTFDVISVETARRVDSRKEKETYIESVKAFMDSKGYLFWDQRGRNSWFMNKKFKPFKKEEVFL